MAKLCKPFERWTTYAGHGGIDFPRARGTVIPASGPGVVYHRNTTERGGNQIWVRYDLNGAEVGYCHMDSFAGCPAVGTRVKAGTRLGYVGSKGKFSTGPHLHIEINGHSGSAGVWRFFDQGCTVGGGSPAGGSTEKADVAKGQRTTGPDGVKRRSAPSSQSAVAGLGLDPGVVGNFDGWIRGESVSGNNVWFRGISGDWFWSGGFTEGANTAGLANLNPAAPAPSGTQRTVLASDVVKRRSQPSSKSAEAGDPLPAGTVGNFDGWVRGENVAGNDVWFRGISGNWFWSGGFVGGANTAGLPDLNAATPTPPVTPTPPSGSVLDPSAPWKNQKPDSELVDAWIGSPNYNNSASGQGAKTKTHIDFHWFGTSATLAGTDAHFQNPGAVKNGRGTGASSQYGIGADGTVHQYVLEKDYAHTNGTYEANATGITIEHESGPGKPATEALIQKSAELCADIARRHGWAKLEWMVNAFPHNHYVKTQCPGDLPTAEILRRANLILAGATPEPEPEPGSTAAELMVLRAELETIAKSASALAARVTGWLS